MEIPYTVKARPDTGLWNAKIGIWLFLASEVMLFGGLFSGYIFLRIGADYPWPIQELDWRLGMLNTVILIASSVTVVFAWASLKMRQWGKFKLYMWITLACAAGFMCIKAVEYSSKFSHHYLLLKDGSVVTGHHMNSDLVLSDVSSVSLDVSGKPDLGVFSHEPHAHHHGDDSAGEHHWEPPTFVSPSGKEVALDHSFVKNHYDVLKKAKSDSFAVTLKSSKPFELSIPRGDARIIAEDHVVMWDGTKIHGTLTSNAYSLGIDLVDLTQVVKAEDAAIIPYLDEKTKGDVLDEISERVKGEEEWIAGRSFEELDLNTQVELRKIYLDDLHDGAHAGEHPHITVPAEEVRFASNFGPKKNTYYSIYFTLTGLHGLHVVGGAIVLAYFLFTGRKMYEEEPEHLANRVEVGGLFWHFVDLIWIFLFPLLYLL